jgi:DNA-binding CsgD family transcriptional regulator
MAFALDWLSYGVVLVDDQIRPIYANTAALVLIDQGRLPLSRKATLHRPDPIESLRQAVAVLANTETRTTITCRIGNPPLVCTVASVPRSSRAQAVLFLTDPEQMRGTRLADLAELGLTRAEAAFAVEFVTGHPLQVCAGRLGISTTTAKSHLQRIFEKTGASRQAELMRLILTATPALRHEHQHWEQAAQ